MTIIPIHTVVKVVEFCTSATPLGQPWHRAGRAWQPEFGEQTDEVLAEVWIYGGRSQLKENKVV